MKEPTYCQAILHKQTPNGYIFDTVWIPSELCRKGRELKIKTADGWDTGWVVQDYSLPRPADIVLAYHENGRRGLPSVSGYEKE